MKIYLVRLVGNHKVNEIKAIFVDDIHAAKVIAEDISKEYGLCEIDETYHGKFHVHATYRYAQGEIQNEKYFSEDGVLKQLVTYFEENGSIVTLVWNPATKPSDPKKFYT